MKKLYLILLQARNRRLQRQIVMNRQICFRALEDAPIARRGGPVCRRHPAAGYRCTPVFPLPAGSHGHARHKAFSIADIAKSMDGVVAVYRFITDIKAFSLSEERLVVALPSKGLPAASGPSGSRNRTKSSMSASRSAVVIAREPAAGGRCASPRSRIEYEAFGSRRRLCCGGVGQALRRSTAEPPHNVVAELDLTFGHVDEVFAQSLATSISDRFHQSRRRQAIRSSAAGGAGGSRSSPRTFLTVWSSTQTPHAAMRLIAHMLRVGKRKTVRVICPGCRRRISAPKLVFLQRRASWSRPSAAVFAQGAPVKWVEDRLREHFISTTQERDQVLES